MTPSALAIRHPNTGETLPPLLTARDAAALLGWDEETVAGACARNELPHLPRDEERRNGPWSIPTARLFREVLGIEPELVAP